MAAPRTPSRPRLADRLGTGTLGEKAAPGSLGPTKYPSRPTELLSPKSANASTVFSPAPATGKKIERVSAAPSSGLPVDGWSVIDGRTVIVDAAMHVRKMAPTCSWLHQFEHARYLHAGLPQSAIKWPDYPYQIEERLERPHLQEMHEYLSTALRDHLTRLSKTSHSGVKRPEPSLWTEFPACESKPEMEAAFRQGSVHFTGSLTTTEDRLIFKLQPPAACMGSALYRRFGSDRFFRISLEEKVVNRSAAPLEGTSSPADTRFRQRIRDFFDHPLCIFGRQFRPFCWKDGAAVFWCESGEGIETISLVEFAQRYLEVELNGSMSVAKYAARFELGLTTTTPTVTFPRINVLRTPDLTSDTLKVSVAAMRAICDELRRKKPVLAAELLPGSYLPSCIRGTVQQYPASEAIDMVWQLDYTTVRTTDSFIQLRPFAAEPSKPARPLLKFSLEAKDGEKVRWQGPTGVEMLWVEGDTIKKDEVVMTDGCSLMSFGAMKIVADKYASSRRDAELQSAIPAVAQGRIGPGKGVWAVAPQSPWTEAGEVWIEVRDSQWKFKDRQTRTFTFELHSVPSGGKGGSKLGKQMFEVLAHCGVPTSAFRKMLRDQINTSLDAFWNAPSTAALLFHVEKSCGILEDRTMKARLAHDPQSLKLAASGSSSSLDDGDETKPQQQESGEFVHDRRLDPTSGAPNIVAEVVVEMLQAGFDPRENPHLADKLRIVAENWISKQTNFRIDDEFSRTAFVIADHLGVLEEGEFFLQVSEKMPAPSGQGYVGNVLGPTLLSRSPAVQPCDVQRATGVFRPEYASYWDVIIVSSKGSRSLCSILSGGDYDGDKLLVMTHPALVTPFDPAKADPAYADPPFRDSDWFEVDRRKVSDHVQSLVGTDDSNALARVFMEGLWAGTQYGMLSTAHTTLAYERGIQDPLTSEAGHLFCRALDGRKQGLSFSADQWRRVKAKFFKPFPHRPEWTFCEDGKKPPEAGKFAVRPTRLGAHPLDELVKEGRSALKEAKRQHIAWAEVRRFAIDEDVAHEWRTAWLAGLAEREKSSSAPSGYFEDLCLILDHVRTVFAEYKELFRIWGHERERKKTAALCAAAPGSPTKSPFKKGWSGSSPDHKLALLQLSKRFWSINDRGSRCFRSQKLQGPDGERAPFLTRLRAAATDLPIASSETVSIVTSPSKVSLRGTAEIVLTTPAGVDEEMADEESFGDADFAWSQVPDDLTQTAITSLASTTSSSQTRTATVISSSHPSAASGPASPSRPPLTNSISHTTYTSAPYRNRTFSELARTSAVRFCFDMAHRDVLALKADGHTRRLHGDHPGASGIQAPKIAPHMLDVMQVSKRCAGLTTVRAKVRPRTLLPVSSEVACGSPAKKPRRL
ncbi:hypothetical protein Rhopal_004311-T1 [Rhodotorula paludigena]|uniref:RNA-dependent RNA polymerase n=1 Tax=Rhodotorula paludigena TaxID=86838 RepID=A0AAV5GP61_9BASI|nr:hypothetical protein Rhopal_004311-T1 [Rhodotorula paludigena]